MDTNVAPSSGLLDGLMRREALCQELDVTPRTIRRFEVRGMPFVKVGNLRLYDPMAVRVWILSHQERATYCGPARRPGRPRRVA